MSVYEDVCYSELKTERVKFLWKVRDFSKRIGYVSSSSFPSSAPEEVGKWILELNASSALDIIVQIVELTRTVNPARVELSFVDDKGDKKWPEHTKYAGGRREVKRIRRPLLCDRGNGLLPNGELTILCEMEVQVSPAKSEPPPCRTLPLSDVTIAVVAGGAELRAHKAVLAARSPVFAAMLEKETGVVEITDVDADVVQAMLEFIYTDVVQTRWAHHNLLAAATKYQLEGLKVACEEVLGKDLTLDNVLENLALADLHGASRLKEHCISFIMAHRDDLRSAWDNLQRSEMSLVMDVLRKNSLSN